MGFGEKQPRGIPGPAGHRAREAGSLLGSHCPSDHFPRSDSRIRGLPQALARWGTVPEKGPHHGRGPGHGCLPQQLRGNPGSEACTLAQHQQLPEQRGGGGDLGPRSRPVPPQGVPRVLTGNLLYLRARRLRGPWVLRGRRRGWNFLERASSHVVPGAPVSESGNLLHGFCFCHLVALWPWVLGSSFGEVGGEKKRSNSRFRSCWGRYSDAHRGKIRRL